MKNAAKTLRTIGIWLLTLFAVVGGCAALVVVTALTESVSLNRTPGEGGLPEQEDPMDATVYMVKEGDTLEGIAKELGMSVKDLAVFTDLPTKNRVYRGDEILVAKNLLLQIDDRSATERRAPTQKLPTFQPDLRLSASRSGRQVTVSGNTSLPDGSVVFVEARRLYLYEDGWHGALRFDDRAAVVSAGRFGAMLTVSRRDDNRIAPGPGPLRVVRVDDEIVIETAFVPGSFGREVDGHRRQPASVTAIVGERGEMLMGSQVFVALGIEEYVRRDDHWQPGALMEEAGKRVVIHTVRVPWSWKQ